MGGGIIRAAVKAPSFGSYRSPLIDQTARRAARHQVSAFSTAEPVLDTRLSASLLSSDRDLTDASAVAHCPAREFDDWELAGGSEEEKFGMASPTPRMVFGPAPTVEEAQEATSDLKEALEKVYLQPNLILSSHEGYQLSDSCESSTVSTIPKHVAQMFSLLQRGTEAQVVVASLATDKSVWDAVMNNEKVVEFCKRSSTTLEGSYAAEPDVTASDFPNESSPSLESKGTSEGSGFADIVNDFKVKVSEMVSNISDFLQGLFGILPGNSNFMSDKASASTAAHTDMTLGAAFVALAVATIMVVLLKRG